MFVRMHAFFIANYDFVKISTSRMKSISSHAFKGFIIVHVQFPWIRGGSKSCLIVTEFKFAQDFLRSVLSLSLYNLICFYYCYKYFYRKGSYKNFIILMKINARLIFLIFLI